MFITAVCIIFLIKLRWPNNKSLTKSIRFSKNYKSIPSVEFVKMKMFSFPVVLTQFCTDLLEVFELWFLKYSMDELVAALCVRRRRVE